MSISSWQAVGAGSLLAGQEHQPLAEGAGCERILENSAYSKTANKDGGEWDGRGKNRVLMGLQ